MARSEDNLRRIAVLEKLRKSQKFRLAAKVLAHSLAVDAHQVDVIKITLILVTASAGFAHDQNSMRLTRSQNFLILRNLMRAKSEKYDRRIGFGEAESVRLPGTQSAQKRTYVINQRKAVKFKDKRSIRS